VYEPGDDTISVKTFDAFQLSGNGIVVERWRAGKAKSLLQYLLMRRGRLVPRDTLYEALWPEANWSRTSSSLKVAVHMLRQILGQLSRADPGGGRPRSSLELVTRDPGYVLETHDVWIDFEVFDELIDAGHAAQQDDRDATSLFHRAAELYQGDFLPDVHADWMVAHREWLRSRLLCALAYLTDTAMAKGDHLSVIRWCRRMLEIEPFHEDTYRALILVHAQMGQLNQVHRWHRLCTARLRDALSVSPHETTQRLYLRAIRGEFVGRDIRAGAESAGAGPRRRGGG
jgi:DNA-binding SARP family transcriptional activator